MNEKKKFNSLFTEMENNMNIDISLHSTHPSYKARMK